LGTTGPGVLELAASPRARFLHRLVASLRAGAWIFVLLAAAEAALNARSLVIYLTSLTPSALDLVDLASIAVAGPITALLPAAILLWRPNAWRTAPVLMLGCVLWAIADPVALLVRWLLSDVQIGGADLTLIVRGAPLVAAVVSRFGGLLLILGLERVRTTTRATWPPLLVLATLALVVWQSAATALSQLSYFDQLSAAGVGDPLWALLTLTSATESVAILMLLGVVWSTLSAVRAGEPPRSMWWLLFAGSALLCVVVSTAHQQGIGIQALGYGDIDFAYYGWLRPWLNPANALGWTAMVGAFVVASRGQESPSA
jgi:hypothetical protein